jgi:heat-inducible transcriptional repressor
MLQEPEFEDIDLLRSIFTTFEARMSLFRDFLESNLSEDIRVFIGDEIGLEHIRNCSLVFSSLQAQRGKKAFLGVLGPIRMNYPLAISKLETLKDYIEEEFLDRT